MTIEGPASGPESPAPRPWIIPFFLPQQGCPSRCLFCNQQGLAGNDAGVPSAAALRHHLVHWLALPRSPDRPVEVAFYGGSFTGLPRPLQEELLATLAPERAAGSIAAIRLSTRPDMVDETDVALFVRHGVGVVELGVQSLDPDVLLRSGRDHTAAEVAAALALLHGAGLRVGCHLMVGLPGENTLRLLASGRGLITLRPDFVRLHPVLVLAGSGLARLFARGEYRPLTLPQAVARVSRLKRLFDEAAIPVLRMGLQHSVALENTLLAGPHHPAFGELVLARSMFRQLRGQLRRSPASETLRLAVNPRDMSVVMGPRRSNLRRLEALGLAARLTLVPDSSQPRHMLRQLYPPISDTTLRPC